MRETYQHLPVPARRATLRADRAHRIRMRTRMPHATAVVVGAATDATAIAFTSVLLWLGAGTTVLSGQPLVMTLAFAGGAVLAALSNLCTARGDSRVAGSLAVVYAALLAGAYALKVTLLPTYFFAWIIVFGAVYIVAKVAIALAIDSVAGRARGAVVWRLLTIATGLVTLMLLADVWRDHLLLIDLIVFVALLAVAGVLFELGIRSAQVSRRSSR